jgi:DNA-binding XRE family transcriptional regulator
MNTIYDKDIDYMEIFFSKEENYGDELNETCMVFKSEKTDEIVGYAFENASTTVFEASFIHLTTKLAALLKMVRISEGLTQDEAAKRIGNITLRHYQRLEAGEDTTLDNLERIIQAFPKQDFSKLIKKLA